MFDWRIILTYQNDLLQGLQTTLQVSACSVVLAMVLGIIAGCGRMMPNFYVVKGCLLYANVLRNIPAVIKVFFAYFVLHLDAFLAGVLALSLHQSSYISDVVAAGIRSLPKGQMEAALCTGLSFSQGFRRVILPQALRITLPPLTTQLIQVVKNSSMVMLISLEELTFMTQKIEHETFRGMEAAIVVTLAYVVVVFIIAASIARLLSVVLLRRSEAPRSVWTEAKEEASLCAAIAFKG